MTNVTRYDDLHIVTRLFVSLLRAKKNLRQNRRFIVQNCKVNYFTATFLPFWMKMPF